MRNEFIELKEPFLFIPPTTKKMFSLSLLLSLSPSFSLSVSHSSKLGVKREGNGAVPKVTGVALFCTQ